MNDNLKYIIAWVVIIGGLYVIAWVSVRLFKGRKKKDEVIPDAERHPDEQR